MQKSIKEICLSNNEFLDIHSLDINKVVEYRKLVKTSEDGTSLHTLKGLLFSNGDKYHKYCGFNKFTKQLYDIPSKDQGWKTLYDGECDEEKILKFKQWVKECICDSSAIVFKPKLISSIHEHTNYKLYKTLDNSNIGFIVLVRKDENMNNSVYVYGRTTDVIENDFDDDIVIFENLIAHYNPLEVFIGMSGINKMTEISDYYGDKYDGNSILLRVGAVDEFRYIHIGIEIFEFVIDEKILSYTSSVGRNEVVYPYAESKNWCYSMNYYIKTLNTEDVKNKGFVSDNVEQVSFVIKPIASVGTDSGRYSARVDPEYET